MYKWDEKIRGGVYPSHIYLTDIKVDGEPFPRSRKSSLVRLLSSESLFERKKEEENEVLPKDTHYLPTNDLTLSGRGERYRYGMDSGKKNLPFLQSYPSFQERKSLDTTWVSHLGCPVTPLRVRHMSLFSSL